MSQVPRDPKSIMEKSMEIIEDYLKEIKLSPGEKAVVKRIIHTTGDPSLVDSIKFSPGAVEAGIDALKKNNAIYTDVNMVSCGINRSLLDSFGLRVYCDIASPEVKEIAKQENITRAVAAVRKNIKNMDRGIVAIGNAPTALFELLELVRRGQTEPALVVGVPVGFVGAAESKEELVKSDLPYITLLGTRGGSPVAAAVVNALLKFSIGKEF